jgi:hypothetical protein
MTLEEAVKLLPSSTIIAIGAQCAFVFIGTVNEYEEKIDEIEDGIVFEPYISSVGPRMKRAERLAALTREARWNKKNMYGLHRKLKALTAMVKELSTSLVYTGQYMPLRSREVRELWYNNYDRRFHILVEGMEEGKYWLKEECERDLHPKGRTQK